MATKPKRKFSAKQLAAQRRFAAMARAGKLKRKTTRRKPAAKKAAPAKRRAAPRKTTARRKNPSGARAPSSYCVYRALHGVASGLIAEFPGTAAGKRDAVEYARAWVAKHRRQALVVGRGL